MSLTPYYRSPAGDVVLYNADCRPDEGASSTGRADVVTFASEALCLQDRWLLVLSAVYTDPATGAEAVTVLAGWDGERWRPSAFALLTNLQCDWQALPPPPEMTAADRGSVLLLHPVCPGAEVARAYAAFLELSGGHPAGRWLAEGGCAVGHPEGLLAGLGDRPDTVAERLLALGCRGVRASRGRCPVAVYMRRVGFRTASVDHVMLEWDDVCRAYLPDAVSSFVRLFDLGLYPALDAGREEG